MKMFEVCYVDYAFSEMYAMSCGHMYCVFCIHDDMSVKINDGKTRKFPCLQSGCELEYSESELKRFLSEDDFRKYQVI